MSSLVLLVRHGDTEWSRSGQHTSRTDLPLLPDGEAAAEALGRRLKQYELALVLTSPLMRARETARLAGLDADVEVTDDLRELGYGEYEGRTTADIRVDQPGWSIWTHGAPDGESLADAAARADRVIARAQEAGGDVALFAPRTHPADPRRALARPSAGVRRRPGAEHRLALHPRLRA